MGHKYFEIWAVPKNALNSETSTVAFTIWNFLLCRVLSTHSNTWSRH